MKVGLYDTTTKRGSGEQKVWRPKISTILTGILAAFNVILSLYPPLDITYLALMGGVGGVAVVMDYAKLPWARYLSIGAALMSLAAAISAIVSAIVIYPLTPLTFLSLNLIHLTYFVISGASLVASIRSE
jgi:hypothetical protein